MILPEGHFAARQFGVGRTCSGPTGYKMKPGRILSRAKGDQYGVARKSWIWQLYATPANLHPEFFKPYTPRASIG